MHELSLATNIVEYHQRLASEGGMNRTEAVFLEAGDMSYMEPSQLRYSFKIASQGTVAEGSKVCIERRRVVLRCTKCGKEKQLKLMESFSDLCQSLKCPFCRSPDVEIDKGKELLLKRAKGCRADCKK